MHMRYLEETFSKFFVSNLRERLLRRRFLPILACISLLFTGCFASTSDPFPKVTQPVSEETEITNPSSLTPTPTQTIDPSLQELTIAAPISDDTANYLAKLYTLKNSVGLDENVSGANIDLSVLDAVTADYSVEIVQTPSTGASEAMLDQWETAGIIPDIILADSLSSFSEKKTIISLSDLLAGNSLLSPDRIYYGMFQSCMLGDEIYGIPYSATGQVVFVNMEVLNRAGIEQVSFDLDMDTLSQIASQVQATSTKDTPLDQKDFTFDKALDLLMNLPSSFDNTLGWLTYHDGGYSFDGQPFADSVSYIRSFVSDANSCDSLSSEELVEAFSSLDPRLSKRVAMWVGSSDEVSIWSITMPYTLQIARIPTLTMDDEFSPALTVYPLCVSGASDTPQLAADFASFLALDEDAILLSQRLENTEGFLPVISSSTVWNAYFSESEFGSELAQFRDNMDQATYSPQTNHEDLYNDMIQIVSDHSADILNPDTDMDTLIEKITASATS